MSIDEVLNAPWTRKHDLPGSALTAPTILYPTSLEDLIQICSHQHPRAPTGTHLKAAGSHWALSGAAVSDDVFVETHDPQNVHTAMGRTLYDVVPGCLNPRFVEMMAARHPPRFGADNAPVDDDAYYLVHVETGKRVYQLYAELDGGDDLNPDSLAVLLDQQYANRSYYGPWAFHTLGGAGGQTVFGALTTGTHGGDYLLPPIADDVAALHLVADGGRHYWIEPKTQPGAGTEPLTDEGRLRALYGTPPHGGPTNFEVIRDDALFNAVLISAGRFGVVYSIVLRAVRQYAMHERRRLETWQEIRHLVGDPTSSLYTDTGANAPNPNRFLLIVLSLTPHENFSKNLCGVTRRWNDVPMPTAGDPNGRRERVGRTLEPFDPRIGGPRFEFAGASAVYTPDPDNPDEAAPLSMLERACADADILEGVLAAVIEEIERYVEEHKVLIGGILAAAVVTGVAGTLILLVAALTALLAPLLALLDALRQGERRRLGEVMDALAGSLLNAPGPFGQAAGLLVWQMISYSLFSRAQRDLDYNAISYAVLDGHNYLDRSCNTNADSIEVFFDATDPMLLAFIDALIAFEIRQEAEGRAFVGYVSLRFTGPTAALIGMERHRVTCAVEVGGLKDVAGVTELIDFAIALSRDRNFGGILHWGQRNDATRVDTELHFGDPDDPTGGDLGTWRQALAQITNGGRLDSFSSTFTRQAGLEVF